MPLPKRDPARGSARLLMVGRVDRSPPFSSLSTNRVRFRRTPVSI
ncbi:hypothetical protein Z950_2596 [Sulfitobacter mediterraneus KCTC 32188]|nr:hypothetical protein Z950_2596 [Sulfitobacter mediterraneus KCTC 32188]